MPLSPLGLVVGVVDLLMLSAGCPVPPAAAVLAGAVGASGVAGAGQRSTSGSVATAAAALTLTSPPVTMLCSTGTALLITFFARVMLGTDTFIILAAAGWVMGFATPSID